jgi:ATP-binding cassette subfamily B protein
VPARATDLGLSLELLRYLRPHWRLLPPLLLAVLAEAGFDILYPLGVKLLIDNAVATRDGQLLARLLGGLVVVFLLGAVGGVARDRLSATLGARAMRDVRARLLGHLQRLSADFYMRHETGDLIARFSGDLVAIGNAYTRTLTLAVYSAIGVVVGVPLLFVLDWRLSLLTVAALPAAMLGPRLFGGRASAAGYRRREVEGEVTSSAQEAIAGHQVIRAFGLQRLFERRFDGELAALAADEGRATFLQRLVGRTGYVGTNLAQLAIIAGGALLVFEDAVTIGTFIGFVGLLISVSGAVSGLASAIPEWLQALASMRRLDDVLRETPSVRDAPGATTLARFRRELRLDGVSFSYTGEQQNLRDVTLTIRAGQTVALVGRSGSGKSTIFNLLGRFYEPSAGSITIDGRDLRSLSQESLRAQLGVVFQDSFLFRGTIRENIRLGKPDASDAEVEAAARAAQIHDLVAGWPDGYETDVGERGGRLSGGQRQRVALARALVREPAILLLDEATSALDPATEAAFNETLAQLGRDRTIISVTHRLSGAAGADQIFVLADGQLAESGTHAELLALGGTYSQLWQQQQEGLSISRDGQRAAITGARLKSIEVFRGLADADLEPIAARFSSERIAADRVVFAQGDAGDKFYVIAHGKVEVVLERPEGAERLRVLEDGDVFGEVALLRDAPRTATIRTLTPCLFLTLSRDQFADLMDHHPGLREAMSNLARERVDRGAYVAEAR